MRFILCGLLFSSVNAVAQVAETAKIESISYSGSGCPDGSVAVQIAADGQAFTVLYAKFLVDSSINRGQPTKKSCELNLQFSPSERRSFAVMRVDTRGFGYLEAGAVGVARTVGKMAGTGFRTVGRTKIVGPYNDSYQSGTNVQGHERDWSQCKKKNRLILKTVMQVRPTHGFSDDLDTDSTVLTTGPGSFPAGYMTVDSSDGSVLQTYRLTYLPCGR